MKIRYEPEPDFDVVMWKNFVTHRGELKQAVMVITTEEAELHLKGSDALTEVVSVKSNNVMTKALPAMERLLGQGCQDMLVILRGDIDEDMVLVLKTTIATLGDHHRRDLQVATMTLKAASDELVTLLIHNFLSDKLHLFIAKHSLTAEGSAVAHSNNMVDEMDDGTIVIVAGNKGLTEPLQAGIDKHEGQVPTIAVTFDVATIVGLIKRASDCNASIAFMVHVDFFEAFSDSKPITDYLKKVQTPSLLCSYNDHYTPLDHSILWRQMITFTNTCMHKLNPVKLLNYGDFESKVELCNALDRIEPGLSTTFDVITALSYRVLDQMMDALVEHDMVFVYVSPIAQEDMSRFLKYKHHVIVVNVDSLAMRKPLTEDEAEMVFDAVGMASEAEALFGSLEADNKLLIVASSEAMKKQIINANEVSPEEAKSILAKFGLTPSLVEKFEYKHGGPHPAGVPLKPSKSKPKSDVSSVLMGAPKLGKDSDNPNYDKPIDVPDIGNAEAVVSARFFENRWLFRHSVSDVDVRELLVTEPEQVVTLMPSGLMVVSNHHKRLHRLLAQRSLPTWLQFISKPVRTDHFNCYWTASSKRWALQPLRLRHSIKRPKPIVSYMEGPHVMFIVPSRMVDRTFTEGIHVCLVASKGLTVDWTTVQE